MHKDIRILNWSSGKDAAYALWMLRKQNKVVDSLLTTLNESNDRVSMHGLREGLLDRQAASIGLPLHKINLPDPCSMDEYNSLMKSALAIYETYQQKRAVFGDIFLRDLREYREQQLSKAGFEAEFPLWGIDTKQLALQIIDAGFKAVVICVNAASLDASFCGRAFDRRFIDELPENIDPCGENGEFHTFVFDGPVFKKPVRVRHGQTVKRTYPSDKGDRNFDREFYYTDLLPY
jgi:uncharacterized protein (TIGR00290 family)